jgi:hypothetical protein
MRNARNRRSVFSVLATLRKRKQQPLTGTVVVNVMAKEQTPGQANYHALQSSYTYVTVAASYKKYSLLAHQVQYT